MNTKLTDRQKLDYLNSNGANCPFCDRQDCYPVGHPKQEGYDISLKITCIICDEHWKEYYKLYKIENI